MKHKNDQPPPLFNLSTVGESISPSYSISYDGLLNSISDLMMSAYLNVSAVCYYTDNMVGCTSGNRHAYTTVLSRLVSRVQSYIHDSTLKIDGMISDSIESMNSIDSNVDTSGMTHMIQYNDYSILNSDIKHDNRIDVVSYIISSYSSAYSSICGRRMRPDRSQHDRGDNGKITDIRMTDRCIYDRKITDSSIRERAKDRSIERVLHRRTLNSERSNIHARNIMGKPSMRYIDQSSDRNRSNDNIYRNKTDESPHFEYDRFKSRKGLHQKVNNLKLTINGRLDNSNLTISNTSIIQRDRSKESSHIKQYTNKMQEEDKRQSSVHSILTI